MMTSPPLVNSGRTSTGGWKKKKKKKPPIKSPESSIEWNSEAQHQTYSSKLIQALQQLRLTDGGSRRVHEAADRVLAASAKGRSRWSRAILTNRPKLKLKFMKRNTIVKRERKLMTVITTGSGSRRRRKNKSKLKISRLQSKSFPAVERKARLLGRLVPGCRKQSLPVVLEEATDYIAALQMQVRAMSGVAELLGGGGGGGGGDSTQNNFRSNSGSSKSPPAG